MEIPPLSRMVKWLILVGFYFQAFAFCISTVLVPFLFWRGDYQSAQSVNELSNSFPFFMIAGLMGIVAWAYHKDKEREHHALDDFKNDNLLYRYGYKINETTIPVPVKPEWTDKEIERFVEALRQKIASQIQSRFASAGVQVANAVSIKDTDLPSDDRKFLKVIFRSKRGSQASHFITYAIAGKYVVIHYLSRIRGTYRWHDVVDFIIFGPLSIWFWGVDWLQNQYSIIAAISRIVRNSYDQLDLMAYFEASYLVLLEETRNFLKEQGLLTEELNQIIINNINNSQNIEITGSQNVSIGEAVNAVQSAARGLIGQS
jgi:hypothetical protein